MTTRCLANREKVYTDTMRRRLVFAFSALLLLNTTLVSAWASPCLHDMRALASTATSTATADLVPPCHSVQEKQESSAGEHCEDLCLCTFAAHSPSLFVDFGQAVHFLSTISQSFSIANEASASFGQAPLLHPPKHSS